MKIRKIFWWTVVLTVVLLVVIFWQFLLRWLVILFGMFLVLKLILRIFTRFATLLLAGFVIYYLFF